MLAIVQYANKVTTGKKKWCRAVEEGKCSKQAVTAARNVDALKISTCHMSN